MGTSVNSTNTALVATRLGMALFATGFNAWGQLSLDRDPGHGEPDDLFSFAKVLEAQSIERPVAGLSYTLVRRDGVVCMAGVGLGHADDREAAYTFAEAANGEILGIQDDGTLVSGEEGGSEAQKVLAKYPCRSAVEAQNPERSWRCKSPVRTIAAFDAGFVILYQDGTVATLGDARFEDCLGRDITDDSPADEPGIVPDLANLAEPIKHVSAGGYALAALTESGGIYLWGMSPSGAQRGQQPFSTLCGVPNYVEVDDGDRDVQDVALGDSHAIALTTDGSVFVIGDNSSGQIGLGKTAREQAHPSWTKVSFDAPDGHEVVAVAAGPRSSFILTSPVQA
ncbi:E3 ISG15-protein ligase Herc6 [Tolypocladium capitatum]|uniref:E3 ISG15-protein ligase Herc6 n=1 Tax=Tolypocladium capitatum TaxID=45235 RepID=A0A2K3PXC9_9HYPO|nr:E3 ISG15-protein ligase Herc6 [Tolypocladium capitatum]